MVQTIPQDKNEWTQDSNSINKDPRASCQNLEVIAFFLDTYAVDFGQRKYSLLPT